ncbi:MAG: pyridoxal phosphate-dependent aminotransferase [Lentisphaeria bacterium]|nr:pyridoxal phosphate-dependent aminotransferase [Lentisphaeria bacterium]
MQLLNDEIKNALANSSWIRRMFEAGLELKKKYGEDAVCDFSLGNPDLPPPAVVGETLREIAAKADAPFAIGYMPNAGYMSLREKLASLVSREQVCTVPAANVIVTCGAAGGLNVFFRAVLSPGDEVISPSPYFVEYNSYVANAGGKLVTAPSKELTFELDIDSFRKALSPKTRAIIINSPNNPTGQIYGREELAALGKLVREHEEKTGRPLFVLSDEPYRFLNFEGVEIPPVMAFFKHAAVIGSFSKNLSLAGERLGYIAVSPQVENAQELMAGLIMCNRILGFVNAPALGQQILEKCLDAQVDLDVYRRRRDAMAKVLRDAGVAFTLPRGAFYFFAKSPVEDECKFVDALLEQRILAVPGRGFGKPGYIRLACCVDEKIILRSAAGFAAAVRGLKK